MTRSSPHQSLLATLAVGELLWSNLRGVIYAVAFLAVMFAFGLVASPLALLTPFAVMFIGFAFGAAGFAIDHALALVEGL